MTPHHPDHSSSAQLFIGFFFAPGQLLPIQAFLSSSQFQASAQCLLLTALGVFKAGLWPDSKWKG